MMDGQSTGEIAPIEENMRADHPFIVMQRVQEQIIAAKKEVAEIRRLARRIEDFLSLFENLVNSSYHN